MKADRLAIFPHALDDQRQAIRDTVEAIRAATGKPPRGWESPGLTETFETADLLAEEGIEYVADWILDDQPLRIQTTAGPLISVPYTVELNDIPMSALQHHRSDEILRRGIDHFDRLYEEGAEHTRVMAISVHPFLTGAPHRIKYLEQLYDYIGAKSGVCMMTGEEILDWNRPAVELARQIRAFSPRPGARFNLAGESVKALAAALGEGSGRPGELLSGDSLTVACGDGALRLTRVQRPGRAATEGAAFLRGARIKPGSLLA